MQSEDDNRHKVIEVLAQANPDLIVLVAAAEEFPLSVLETGALYGTGSLKKLVFTGLDRMSKEGHPRPTGHLAECLDYAQRVVRERHAEEMADLLRW
jgi:hypothetical protein